MKKYALAITVVVLTGCASNTHNAASSPQATDGTTPPPTQPQTATNAEVRDGIRTTREGIGLVRDIINIIK